MGRFLIGFLLGVSASATVASYALNLDQFGQAMIYGMTRGRQVVTALALLGRGDDHAMRCATLKQTNDALKPSLSLLNESRHALVLFAVETFRLGAFRNQGFDRELNE